LKAGNIDQRVLMEFRDSVDYVRKTAWVVYEWQERQVRHRDTATVLPLLTIERLRRATQLCGSIGRDLEAQPGQFPEQAVTLFLEAVARIQQQLSARRQP